MSIIDKAFILGAGLGTRMRPLTNDRPKPLIEINGQTLLSRALDQLEEAGVKEVAINTHYLADKIENHLKNRKSPKIKLFYEPELLDTGGGIRNALDFFDHKPFYTLSGDGYWEDAPGQNTLLDLAKVWDDETMDILLLVQKVESMNVTKGIGDYKIDAANLPKRMHDQSGDLMFTSIRIHHPRIFENTPKNEAFSYLSLMDKAENEKRLHVHIHAGIWHHLSTSNDVEKLNDTFSNLNKSQANM